MHLPAHPLWFWFILLSPFLIWWVLWAIARFGQISLKPLTPWLRVGMFISVPAFVPLEASDGHKTLRLSFVAIFYTCLIGISWIQRRYMFETLRASSEWYKPWGSARFSVSQNARIPVKDLSCVAPWYIEKLGLREASSSGESGIATYRFKEDGKSITLTTRLNTGTDRALIFFTKRIGKMKEVLSARGITVGEIEQDRQGTRYFEIHDPEGNAIEIVQEP